MKESVVIKGTKSGIILVLDDQLPYEQLKEAVADKFHSSDEFLGNVSKAISFQGRELTDEQQEEIISIIHENCHLNIVCITIDDPEKEADFSRAIENKYAVQDANTGQFFKGTLRSGQVLEMCIRDRPYAMPGYHSDVIMAAGAFIQGSSIELSADGPIEPPFAVYFQGGLTWYHARFGITM